MARSRSPRRRNRSQSPSRLAKLNASSTDSSSTNTSNINNASCLPKEGAELHASAVALQNLPRREQPSFLTIKVHKNGKVLSTGPPASRHKDRNSFKFGPLAQNLVVSSKTLSQLYAGHLYVEVVYENAPKHNLIGSMPVSDLWVNDNNDDTATGTTATTTTTILKLEAKDAAAAAAAAGLPTVVDLLDEIPIPTLKWKLELKARMRPEMETLQQLIKTWFGIMDHVESSWFQLVDATTSGNKKLYFLVPAVPMATGTLMIAPIVAGLCVLFLPLFMPILCAILTIGACAVGTGLVLVGSTSRGRTFISSKVPLQQLQHTETMQALLYPTGPRPNPVSLAKLVLPNQNQMWARLMVSLVVDAIGSASYLVPLAGEATDLIWAPLQTILIMAMYDTTTPHLK